MVWHGYRMARVDSQKGDPVYFQEWRVEVFGMQPPTDEIRSIFHARDIAMPAPDGSQVQTKP